LRLKDIIQRRQIRQVQKKVGHNNKKRRLILSEVMDFPILISNKDQTELMEIFKEQRPPVNNADPDIDLLVQVIYLLKVLSLVGFAEN
jgi:hypothetical protein